VEGFLRDVDGGWKSEVRDLRDCGLFFPADLFSERSYRNRFFFCFTCLASLHEGAFLYLGQNTRVTTVPHAFLMRRLYMFPKWSAETPHHPSIDGRTGSVSPSPYI
jgi:hypothetical protein